MAAWNHCRSEASISARPGRQYRLLRELAAGAMGRLVEAEHLLLERPVAIKLYRHAGRTRAGA
jgi:hypothetical protein